MIVIVGELHDLRGDRLGLLLEFLGVLDKAGRCVLIADRLRKTPRRRRALAIRDHA